MTTPAHSASYIIKLKIRELRAHLATLTAALAIFGGKRTELSNGDDAPKKARKIHQDQFDAMMSILTARKGRALTAAQLRQELKAKGQHTGTSTTVFNHLTKAIKRGYVLKRADGYRVSPNIQKITQKAALEPHAPRRVNGVAAPKNLKLSNFDFVLKALRAADGPQKGSAIQAAANQLGAEMKKDTAAYGFLTRAVKLGLAKKSADGYQITEKGKGTEA